VLASGERFLFDYIIAGTGYRVDPRAMQELQGISAAIATWGDRFLPHEEEKDENLARYPYLGDAYQYTEKAAGIAPFLSNLHCFNFGAMVSYGRHIGDVGSLRLGIARLVSGISRDLFLEEHARRTLPLNVITELTGDEYGEAVWPAGAVARHANA
jgi:cation diffusion facilitator CzcD-associated flavoprotein CzcO